MFTCLAAYLFSCRKSERKITFDQFREALKLLAEKKYPGDADGAKKLEDFVLQGKGPTGNKTTVCLLM